MKKLLITSVLLTFIFVTLFGLNLSMQMHTDGSMSNCPLMIGQSSICQMSTTEHISWWQQLFTVTPQPSSFLFLSLIIFVGLTFLIFQFSLAPPSHISRKHYEQNYPEINLFNDLLRAFSDGILHSRLYA